MTKILLILHVLAAVIAVGPVTVAGSMFPAAARKAAGAPDATEAVAAVRLLHRICRVYAVVGLAVPVFGFATAGSLHVLGTAWLIVSIVLTGVAALVLALLVLPAQENVLAGLAGTGSGVAAAARPEPARIKRLAMLTGVFNLLWATVTVLMIVRPGSTTGV
ncbi:hypothetical protein AB0L00_35420 [Actinoallomurus sp. NPDC052308]|uniref:DUF2269 family protein n=1 Tax=Actinoallomurus sp. NPDC052308 TaxID=3155530 RepID=UPI003445E279